MRAGMNIAIPPSEPPGSNFDRTDVNRIKSRLDPLGETLTYIERLEEVVRAAHVYYWGYGDSEDGEQLARALEGVHWTQDLS